MAAANFGVGIWAGIWAGVAAIVAYRARRGDRLNAAGWMIVIAAFLAAQEDPGLLIWMASVGPGVDRDGVVGLVHPHTIGHMYGGAFLALAGLLMCGWVARTAFRRGERWAWNALLMFLLVAGGVDIYEVLFIYPHGFPLGATPADGVRGFGWLEIAAWILIWATALAYSRSRPKQAAAGSGDPDADPKFVHPFRALAKEKATVRFETPPGHQAQVDWGTFKKPGRKRVQGFVMTLGWSRTQYLDFTDSQALALLLACHEQAFHDFGGVPEEILYDRVKTVWLREYERVTSSSALASSTSPTTTAFGLDSVAPNVRRTRARPRTASATCARTCGRGFATTARPTTCSTSAGAGWMRPATCASMARPASGQSTACPRKACAPSRICRPTELWFWSGDGSPATASSATPAAGTRLQLNTPDANFGFARPWTAWSSTTEGLRGSLRIGGHRCVTHSRNQEATDGHGRTRRRAKSRTRGHWRNRRDTRGHEMLRVRDREAPGSNPGPPTNF